MRVATVFVDRAGRRRDDGDPQRLAGDGGCRVGDVGDSSASYCRPRRELLRAWCGSAAGARWDELAELRKEIKRVDDVAERAIEALRAAGHKAAADRLARELGETVEMLRVEGSER